jgi:nitric oxide reductase activation protein
MGEKLAAVLASEHKQAGNMKIVVAVPEIKPTYNLTAGQLDSVRRSTNSLRSRLSGMLQSKVLQPLHIGYHGRLDMRGLHKLFTGSGKVFRRERLCAGINTAVHILLDASASMNGTNMELAARTCYAVASALNIIPGISLAVTIFPGGVSRNARDKIIPTVTPLLRPGQKLHQRFAVNAAGGTPMDAALWWALAEMAKAREKRKLLFIISDGMPDSLPAASAAIQAHRQRGVEVYGLGICCQSIVDLLPESSRVINDIAQLPEAVFTMLQKALLK